MAKSVTSIPAVPTNFVGLKDIDNLSLAGIGVWLICIVVQSFFPSMNSYWLRCIALVVSLTWAIIQFAKNQQWRNGASYLIIAINACLIFVSASGMNSVTRQNPFSGEMVDANLDTIKKKSPLKAGIFNLNKQTDWFPDYEMIKFIDTLKSEITIRNNSIENYKNLFSYLKDDIKSNTTDRKVLDIINKFKLKDESDSSYLDKIKESFQKRIDSLQRVITQKEASFYTQTETVNFEGQDMDFNHFLVRSFNIIDSLKRSDSRSRAVLDFIRQTKKIPANIDSL
ncbi:MAG: hypothetical protein JWQ27_2318 [Ferruginibacter sp.]|nr:hypothetical protein [Ferruginibacter sp.]